MPTIAIEGPYHLIVHSRDHNPPHCHVRWGGKEATVALGSVGQIEGDHLPAKGLAAVRKHLDALRDAWDRYNGGGS